jgi:hypothetical protein
VSEPFFQIPLNLPHAATVALRLVHHLQRRAGSGRAADAAREIVVILMPYRAQSDNPAPVEAARVADDVASRARELVATIEAEKLGSDYIGQAVRNLFECLERGEEGARLSLRAGENPDSALRPR